MKLTDLINTNDTSALKASKDRQEKLMELGYFKCHIQGYREEKYFETCSALDRAIAEIHPPEDNDNRHAMLTRTDAEEGDDNHFEYDFYSNEKDGQVMGSDIYIKIDDDGSR